MSHQVVADPLYLFLEYQYLEDLLDMVQECLKYLVVVLLTFYLVWLFL